MRLRAANSRLTVPFPALASWRLAMYARTAGVVMLIAFHSAK